MLLFLGFSRYGPVMSESSQLAALPRRIILDVVYIEKIAIRCYFVIRGPAFIRAVPFDVSGGPVTVYPPLILYRPFFALIELN